MVYEEPSPQGAPRLLSKTPTAVHILRARFLLIDPEHLAENAGVVVEGGRILRILIGGAALRRAQADPRRPTEIDLGEAVLTPALIDAHAHLDLTALGGRLSGEKGFGAWVTALLEARSGCTREQLARGVREGARRLLATGTAVGGDIDACRVSPEVLARHPLEAVVYREALDVGEAQRRRSLLAELGQPLGEGVREGLSPHAPFTVGPELFGALGRIARDRNLPVAIHWSETEEEVRWLTRGEGPLAALLGDSPGRGGLELIEEAGLLGPGTALIHGNHPTPNEIERVAQAGATLVHCPGTHHFFGRSPAPLERYRAAGVSLALGTDSLASNTDLDMRREMALLRRAHPGFSPEEVWTMATVAGARALGRGEGILREGQWADLAAFATSGRDRRAILEELTAGSPQVLGTWPAGGGA